MIMNEFLNKTIKAAKQSALQIYEDDFSNLSLRISREDHQQEREKGGKDQPKSGVVFERSSNNETDHNPQQVSSTLQSLRRYAAQQTSTEINEIENWSSSGSATVRGSTTASDANVATAQQLYSRKDIRKKNLKHKNDKNTKTTIAKDRRPASEPENFSGNDQSQSTERTKNDMNIRLNRLESLVQLLLSSEDLSYGSHPLFQKLLYKGVPKRMIVKWFDTICGQGINPHSRQQLFASRLKLIIRDLVSGAQSERLSRIMLFAGRSGSGKTSLITRLSRHPNFLKDKNVALAAIYSQKNTDYYSTLPQFCSDKNIPYYRIDSETTFRDLYDKWKKYDHVLVDTPSLEMEGHRLVETVSELKAACPDPSEIDIHYLIDTAIESNAFNDPLAAEIGANHIVLTQLDRSNKWGRSVQLIAQTNYLIRFISGGEATADSLLPFDSKLFTEKLLR